MEVSAPSALRQDTLGRQESGSRFAQQEETSRVQGRSSRRSFVQVSILSTVLALVVLANIVSGDTRSGHVYDMDQLEMLADAKSSPDPQPKQVPEPLEPKTAHKTREVVSKIVTKTVHKTIKTKLQPADLNARVVPDTFAPVVPVTNAPVPPPVTQDPTALPTPVPTVTPTVAPTGFPAIVTDSPTISPTDSPTSPAEFTIPPILETSTSEQRMHYIDMATGLFSPQCKAALEEMGATMSTQACTSDEQLESSLLFGLAFKHHAKASEVKQFCETACIQKLLTIIRKTVALYCNLGDSNSYLTKMTRVCSSPTIPPTSVPTAVPTFQPTNAPREPIPPLVPPPATAAPVIPVSRATVQLDESMQAFSIVAFRIRMGKILDVAPSQIWVERIIPATQVTFRVHDAPMDVTARLSNLLQNKSKRLKALHIIKAQVCAV